MNLFRVNYYMILSDIIPPKENTRNQHVRKGSKHCQVVYK